MLGLGKYIQRQVSEALYDTRMSGGLQAGVHHSGQLATVERIANGYIVRDNRSAVYCLTAQDIGEVLVAAEARDKMLGGGGINHIPTPKQSFV